MEQDYLDLLEEIRYKGVFSADRTGTGTYNKFGAQLRFDLQKGFPLLTTKRVNFNAIVHELLWFLSGETFVQPLQKKSVHIWDAWADEDGYLGPIYGKQWRNWNSYEIDTDLSIDQIQKVINTLKTNPEDRGNLVSAWNVADLSEMKLRPCHFAFQVFVIDNAIHMHVFQRSADMFLGVPFNIASYALLTHMLAQVTGYDVGELVWTGSVCHVYINHLNQVDEQLLRDVRQPPTLNLNPDIKNINEFTFKDIKLVEYKPHKAIPGLISV